MQPNAPTLHPSPATHATAEGPMMTAATIALQTQASADVGWPLRLAQRAFAALLDETAAGAPASAFRTARLRSAARRTLSALSADESTHLLRWLALQLATVDPLAAARSVPHLARVDAGLASGVEAAARRLAPRRRGGAAAA
jgi:hypothetical protein